MDMMQKYLRDVRDVRDVAIEEVGDPMAQPA